MGVLPIFPLANLAESFANHLFADEMRDRLAHHCSHGAPKRWLAMELAYSVNKTKDRFAVKEWTALVARKGVDVTLVQPGNNSEANPTKPRIHIECYIVGPTYWSVWHHIHLDLTGKDSSGSKSRKPRADYAVCFLYDYSRSILPEVGPEELEQDRMRLATIPDGPGAFTPYFYTFEFVLLHTSKSHCLDWPEPIPGSWDYGFAIDMRILWIAKPLAVSL